MSNHNGSQPKYNTAQVSPRRLIRLHPREDSFEVSQGRTILSTNLNGFVLPNTSAGLFVHQTRMLSCYRWLIEDAEPLPTALSNVEQHSWLGYYIQLPNNLNIDEEDRGSGEMAAVSERSLELRLSRSVSFGVHEDVDLTNYTQEDAKFTLYLEVDADFADQAETVWKREQFGDLKRSWRRNQDGNWELFFDYTAHHHYEHQGDIGDATIHRSIAIEVANCSTPPSWSGKAIAFQISLKPMQTWHACIRMHPQVEDEPSFPLYGCYSFQPARNPFDESRHIFLAESTQFSSAGSGTLSSVVVNGLEQAKQDLAALRMHDLDVGERAWVPAAGIPIFVALFGRDALTVSWEASIVSTQMMQGVLPQIAKLQGRVVDDWRDEQPGRMLHEAHTAPLAKLGFNPRARYYGSVTTSGFYPVVLAQLWHWTGDKQLIAPLIDPALDALRWRDTWADLDGDGFSEYLTRSTQGTKNQGWKDSGDAIVYEDGSQVEPPIATCEEQAFVYVSKLHMAEMLWWLDRKDEAHRLYHEAADLKKRFNEAFWMEDLGYFALGLDSRKRQIRSITSNPGHCVACGFVDDALVQRTVDRLLADDMFTGWGVRTLSAQNPAFNPFSYHRGSVWPVEHGSFAIGFMRYGLHAELEKVARGIFDIAALFDFQRLPEVFSGHQRDEAHPFPALYPKTNWPQAWSSSAMFTIVQCMLGLYPYAPLHALFVDPHLPDWLPEITLSNLHVGEAIVAIRFYREGNGKSSYEVLDKRGTLHVVRQPSPWSMTAGPIERVVDALASLLPSH
jgi:glycogen debranching enzyme